MYDLATFKMSDMIECGSNLRGLGTEAQSMEAAADRIVHYLYEHLLEQERGQRACALIRFYKTHSYSGLDEELQTFARALDDGIALNPQTKCLTLLATAGELPAWNSRKTSLGHKAIPLPSVEVVSQAPMISQLIIQFGLQMNDVIKPVPALMLELGQQTFNVFYVQEAMGSPFVPAQETFVVPHGIKSVLGFGGLLPDGNLFAVIMFSKVHVPREKADMFKTLSLSAKIAVLPFAEGAVFEKRLSA